MAKANWKTGTGAVVDIRYVGPPGAPLWHWTALIVDLDSGERISALLDEKAAQKNLVVIGDRIQLDYRPGEDAGIKKGLFGGKQGLCRNVRVLR